MTNYQFSQNDFEDGVIRVQAPFLTKSSTAIRLDATVTACDIVDRFRQSDSPMVTNGR